MQTIHMPVAKADVNMHFGTLKFAWMVALHVTTQFLFYRKLGQVGASFIQSGCQATKFEMPEPLGITS